MTTAALNDNLDSQVNQACAIVALQDEIDCRDEEMDDAKRSERKTLRKPRVPTSTSALSHAMLAACVMPAAEFFYAVLISATGLTPRSVSSFCIASSTARVLTEVLAVSMVDSISGFSTLPLRPVHYGSDALHRVRLGGHRAQPTTNTSPTLW